MGGTVVWVACLCLGVLGIPCAVVAQDSGQMQVAAGPRFLAPAGGSSKVHAPRWTDASRLPVLQRRISVDLRSVSLSAALRDVGAKAGLRITYSPNVLRDRVIMLSAETITVGAALGALLYDVEVDVLLMTGGQAVVVSRGQASLPTGDIVGRVIGAKAGEPIVGVDVLLEGTSWRTATDSSGRYALVNVDVGSYTLIARRPGYVKQSRKVTVRADQKDTVNMTLEPVAVALDELVTTATGQQRRRDLGNAITTINADSVLKTAPIRNLTDLLEGRVPGLNVQRTSGAPGDPARLRLRGLGSVTRGNDPVVIVDGIRIYSEQSGRRSGNLTNLGDQSVFSGSNPRQTSTMQNLSAPAPSPLDQIDMNTVEKVDVFKGPSAATLYGADAANGVIVITTKRGKPGPTTWDVKIDHGRTDTPGKWPEGYFNWGHNAHTGMRLFCTLTDPSCEPDSLVRYQALNDPNVTVLGTGQRTAVSLTASGGSQALTYRITGSYGDETGLLTLPTIEAERYRARFNRDVPDWMLRPHHLETWSVNSNVTARLGEKADVTLTTKLSRTEQRRTSLENQISSLAGTYVDRANDLYYTGGAKYVTASTTDFLTSYYTRTTASLLNFNTGLSTTWRPKTWFDMTGQAGLDVTPRNDETYLPAEMVSPVDSGAIIQAPGRSIVSTLNVQGTVRKPMRWGLMFRTSFGANLVTNNSEQVTTSGAQLVPGTTSFVGARLIRATNGEENSSVFGWYIEPSITGQTISLSTGIRLDGGSTYGTNVSGLLGLPKLQAAWTISDEPFFPFKSLFSSLKLRGSYGQAQVQPGPGDRLRLYTRMKEVVGGTTDRLVLTDLGNTQLRPERSTEFEGGFDAEILDSRVSVELTMYRKMQVDALMRMSLAPSVGGGMIYQNIGNVLNKGIELALGLTPIQSSNLTWRTSLNYTHNSNKLVKMGTGVALNRELGIVEGYPLYGRWSRPILGYGDANGNGVLEASEVQIGDSLLYMGQTMPNHASYITSDMTLFGGMFTLSANVSYTAGGTQVDESARKNWVLARPLSDANSPLADRAATLVFDSTTYGLTQDIATFRFSTLALNYRVPESVARVLRAQQMTIGIQGSNLGLHTTYRGKDPNVSAWTPGETIVDTGQLPQPRTWQLSVNLRY